MTQSICLISDDPSAMVVTWMTMSQVNESIVEYGEMVLDHVAKGNVTKFINYGKHGLTWRTTWVHRAVMTELKPGKRYSKWHYSETCLEQPP